MLHSGAALPHESPGTGPAANYAAVLNPTCPRTGLGRRRRQEQQQQQEGGDSQISLCHFRRRHLLRRSRRPTAYGDGDTHQPGYAARVHSSAPQGPPTTALGASIHCYRRGTVTVRGCVCVCVCVCVFVIKRVGGVDVRCVLSKIISSATLATNIAAPSSNIGALISPPPLPPVPSSLSVPVIYCAPRLTATAAHSARTQR